MSDQPHYPYRDGDHAVLGPEVTATADGMTICWKGANYRRDHGPAATQATDAEATARVFAALHQSAEQDVTRVIELYERWSKAGPPIGTSMTGYLQWWREHLAELHDAILPTTDQPKEQ